MSGETPPDQVLEDARYIPMLVIGCISSFLSMMGSACVIYIASKDLQRKILHRLILGLSVADFVSSTAVFFMPFSIPSYIGLTAAVGTHGTCTLTGFFFQLCVKIGSCYNSYLSIYYLLLVRRNWREQDFKKWMERLAHSFAAIVPFALVLAAAITQSINPHIMLNNICIYAPSPMGCEFDNEMECQRSNVTTVRLVSMPTLLFLAVASILGFVCTGMVCYTVQATIRRSSLHRFQGDMDQSQNNRMKQVQIQASLYSLVYFNSLFWPSFAIALTEIQGPELQTKKMETTYYILQLCWWAFFPLQGFLNFFVFTRLKAKQWRKAEPDRSIFWIYQQILFSNQVPPTSSVATTTMASRASQPRPSTTTAAQIAQAIETSPLDGNSNNHQPAEGAAVVP